MTSSNGARLPGAGRGTVGCGLRQRRSAVGYTEEDIYLLSLLRANKGVAWHRVASVVEGTGTAQGLVTGEVAPPNAFAARLVAAVTPDVIDAAAEEVAAWRRRSIQVWSILSDEYPTSLRTVFDRPPFLFCIGHWLDGKDGQGIAVVGTRSPTELGRRRATKLAHELSREGLTIISGLARGIDTAAHEAALEAGSRTVAVMGTGTDFIYPPENKGLAERIISRGGALLSPFVPTQPPARYTFPIRNAVMSGLSRATVVVEAGKTSGAKLQARLALQHGRPVFVLHSLVNTHEWARDYVTVGRYGTQAIEVRGTSEIISALEGPEPGKRQLSLELG